MKKLLTLIRQNEIILSKQGQIMFMERRCGYLIAPLYRKGVVA